MAETMRVECPLEGHEGEYVLFKRGGWKFGHMRRWEESGSSGELAALVSERLAGWFVKGEAGEEIPFVTGEAVFDELPAEVARWLVGTAFPLAYRGAGRPDPNG